MATKSKITIVKKSQRSSGNPTKSTKKFSWKLALPIVILSAIAGVYLVFTSYAGVAVYERTGTMDWRYQGTSRSIKSVVSKDGKLCIASDMNTYNGFGTDFGQGYYFHVDAIENGKWVNIRNSSKFLINGKRKHVCFDAGINRGRSYRVSIDPKTRIYMHGSYWVWGYQHN